MTDLSQPGDSLLDNADFLRRLAHHLAGPVDGDDLLQDAWVAALRRPPAGAGNLRAWFGAVLTNLRRNRVRDRRRRQEREQAVVARGDELAAAEIAAREEVRQRVVAAVLHLPVELRQVVLLRYYEGLDATAIGQRLGLAGSTIRTRLQAAMDRLRDRLDSEHGGRRAAWAVPLAAWRHVPMPPGRLALPLRAFAVGLVAAAAASVAWVIWPVAGEAPISAVVAAGPPPGAATVPVTAPLADAAPAPSPERIGVPALPVARTSERRPSTTMNGVVLRGAGGAPVPGIDVVVRSRAFDTSPFFAVPAASPIERRTLTGLDGTFTFPDLPVGPYDVEASGAAAEYGWVRVELGAEGRQFKLVVVPQPDRGLVTVRVVDEAGAAVSDAQVHVAVGSHRAGWFGWDRRPPLTGSTDGVGRWVLADRPDLAPIEEMGAFARAADGRIGLAYWSRKLSVAPAAITVTVRAAGSIAGRLTGLASYEGVEVIAHPELSHAFGAECFAVAGRVAADGSFRIEGLAAEDWSLQVRGLARRADKEQFWNTPRTRVDAGGLSSCVPPRIDCIPGSRLLGTVTDVDGRPLAGAHITARRPWFNNYSKGSLHHPERGEARWFARERVLTDASGRYELSLHPGSWEVVAAVDGKALDVVPAVGAGSAPVIELRHVLVDEAVLAGSGPRSLMLRAVAQPAVVHSVIAQTFVLRGLRPGTWELGTIDDGVFQAQRTVELVAGRTLWLEAEAEEREFRGVLRHAGKPLADHEVRIGDRGLPVRTGADGSFVLKHRRDEGDGPARLFVQYQRLDIATSDAVEGVIDLPGAMVTIETVDIDGSPLPATVAIGDVFESMGNKYKTYNGPGSVEVPNGRLQFVLTERSDTTAVVATFADGSRCRTTIGQVDAVRLVRPAAGSVQVTLLDARGHEVSGCGVRAVVWGRSTTPPTEPAAFLAGCADVEECVDGKTDGRGAATLHGIGVGPVLMTVLDPTNHAAIAHRIVTVARGQTTVVELRVP